MKLSQEDFVELRTKIFDFLNDGSNFRDGKPRDFNMIETGFAAWELFHRVRGADLYQKYPYLKDVHIKTALKRIFPKAVFVN